MTMKDKTINKYARAIARYNKSSYFCRCSISVEGGGVWRVRVRTLPYPLDIYVDPASEAHWEAFLALIRLPPDITLEQLREAGDARPEQP